MAWPLVAIAMLGAPITGVTFISVPGMVMTKGWSYLQMCLGFFVGYIVIAAVLVPIYYRLNIVSVYEFLERRFGTTSQKTGAWLFFVSKILGVSVRFLVVCSILQLLVFGPMGIPYTVSVAVSLGLVWLSTLRGGVKSVIWGDVLKSVCLLSAIVLCVVSVMHSTGLTPDEMADLAPTHATSRIFHFDDPSDGRYFWKQFVAGIFIVIAMTGLDQDMMQRTLACRNARDAKKNLITGSLLQTLVIGMLLVLGTLLVLYMEKIGESLPAAGDSLFATVAFHEGIPMMVGILFIVGLISATYSSVASAITSMTTTVTIDLLDRIPKENEKRMKRRRQTVHTGISILMAIFVIIFYYGSSDDAISIVYTLISYTDGPILGLFAFGLLTRRQVNERLLPVACIAAPLAARAIQWAAARYFDYEIGYELLLINACFTYCGLWLLSLRRGVYTVAPTAEP